MRVRTWVGIVAAAALVVGSGSTARAAIGPKDISLSVEGGASRFTGPIGKVAGSGGAWAIRLELHTLPWLAVGAAYQGSANRVGGGGSEPLQLLVRDGASAFARASTAMGILEPFLEAGLGVMRLSADGGPQFRGDSALDLPLAAGVLVRAGALRLGVRLGYDVLAGNHVYSGGGGNLLTSSLIVGARL